MKYHVFAALLVLTVLLPSIVHADLPAPLSDFTQVTKNQQFVFVLLAREDDRSAYNQLGYIEQDSQLRQKYPQSGLYRNDQSATPLWTVDWNAYRVDVSSDGRHLIRWGPWARKGDFGELALVFYEDGQEIQAYRVRDLVAHPANLPESVSHYQWSDTATFDDATNTVTVQTLNRERYSFDVRTGTLIKGTLPPSQSSRGLMIVVMIGTLGISGLIGYRLRQRRRASTQ